MRSQISLGEIVAKHPLRHGLAELVAYLQLAAGWCSTCSDIPDSLSRYLWIEA